MRTVAKRLIRRLLAAAKEHVLGPRRSILKGCDTRTFMAAVAERLRFAQPTRTPPITFAFRNSHFKRRFLRDYWFRHVCFLPFLGYTNFASERRRKVEASAVCLIKNDLWSPRRTASRAHGSVDPSATILKFLVFNAKKF
jgi:hypothetical protein